MGIFTSVLFQILGSFFSRFCEKISAHAMLGNEVAYHMVGRPSASHRERGIGTKTVRHES